MTAKGLLFEIISFTNDWNTSLDIVEKITDKLSENDVKQICDELLEKYGLTFDGEELHVNDDDYND